MVGLKNGHIRTNLTQNGEPTRSSWGTQKKKKKKHASIQYLVSNEQHSRHSINGHIAEVIPKHNTYHTEGF